MTSQPRITMNQIGHLPHIICRRKPTRLLETQHFQEGSNVEVEDNGNEVTNDSEKGTENVAEDGANEGQDNGQDGAKDVTTRVT